MFKNGSHELRRAYGTRRGASWGNFKPLENLWREFWAALCGLSGAFVDSGELIAPSWGDLQNNIEI